MQKNYIFGVLFWHKSILMLINHPLHYSFPRLHCVAHELYLSVEATTLQIILVLKDRHWYIFPPFLRYFLNSQDHVEVLSKTPMPALLDIPYLYLYVMRIDCLPFLISLKALLISFVIILPTSLFTFSNSSTFPSIHFHHSSASQSTPSNFSSHSSHLLVHFYLCPWSTDLLYILSSSTLLSHSW